MDARTLLHAEIDELTDEQLVEVAVRVREIKGEPVAEANQSFMAKRKPIKLVNSRDQSQTCDFSG